MSAGEGSDYDDDQQDQDEVVMDNEIEGGEGVADEINEEGTGVKDSGLKIQQKVGDRTCATYTFEGEDHTLGNLLRFALIKNPEVEFCGYSITHPSEHTINMRLQTTGKGTNEIMIQGLESVHFMTDVLEQRFKQALESRRQNEKGSAKKAATKA